jgi:hypothetical protein
VLLHSAFQITVSYRLAVIYPTGKQAHVLGPRRVASGGLSKLPIRGAWRLLLVGAGSTWPDTQEIVARQLTDVPDDEVAKITHQNAISLYRLAP